LRCILKNTYHYYMIWMTHANIFSLTHTLSLPCKTLPLSHILYPFLPLSLSPIHTLSISHAHTLSLSHTLDLSFSLPLSLSHIHTLSQTQKSIQFSQLSVRLYLRKRCRWIEIFSSSRAQFRQHIYVQLLRL